MSNDTVEYCRPEHAANVPLWRMVSDACSGQAAIKREGVLYLPRPNPSDVSIEANQRYAQYLHRAVFYNVCGRTLSSLVGIAYSAWPDIKTPDSIKYVIENADGAGQSIVQVAQMVTAEVLRTGRAGILVDFPYVEESKQTSQDDVAKGARIATMNMYPAHSIVNWRTERVNGSQVLTLVVLREQVNEYGAFGATQATQYRVLQLVDGVCRQQVWTKDADEDDYSPDSDVPVLDAKAKPWNEIPFAFVGAVRNTPEIETFCGSFGANSEMMSSPLYDIAAINIAHYRNSADYEESVYFNGQPQAWMSGLTEEWRDKLIASGMQLGSRSILPLPMGGSFGIAIANPNTLAAEAMKSKEDQMRSLGAKLIQPVKSTKTATQSGHDESNDKSTLSLVCDNTSFAMEQALEWMLDFMGGTGECQFSIDTDFVINPLDAQSVLAALQVRQAGEMSQPDFWAYLRKLGLIDSEKTDDAIRLEIESEPVNPTPVAFATPPAPAAQVQVDQVAA